MKFVSHTMCLVVGLMIGGALINQTFVGGGSVFGPAIADCDGLEISNVFRESHGDLEHKVCFGTFSVIWPE